MPLKTSSEGPSNIAISFLSQEIFKFPPSKITSTLSSTNPLYLLALAEAVLPVPDDKVSPAPLSNILALILSLDIILTISKLILFVPKLRFSYF